MLSDYHLPHAYEFISDTSLAVMPVFALLELGISILLREALLPIAVSSVSTLSPWPGLAVSDTPLLKVFAISIARGQYTSCHSRCVGESRGES